MNNKIRQPSKARLQVYSYDNNLSNVTIPTPIFLQQSLGNQSLQRLIRSARIQTKLKISHPRDVFEQEADRVAEQIMRTSNMSEESYLQTKFGGRKINRKYKANEGSNQSKIERGREEKYSLNHINITDVTDNTARHNKIVKQTGSTLDKSTKEFMQSRFVFDFSNVSIHTDENAAASATSVNALAYTLGRDIVFGKGHYQPNTLEGRRLLAHELTHVVQQSKNGYSNSTANDLRIHAVNGHIVQRKPKGLIPDYKFLGNLVGGGIGPELKERLVRVEEHLKAQYSALDFNKYGSITFTDWAGINSVRSWRPTTSQKMSKHQSGSAVDVNYDLQPYIVTRSFTEEKGKNVTYYGGEAAGAHLQAQRKAALEVYERAVQFYFKTSSTVDVGARHKGESTGDVYRRFASVSNALANYCSIAFKAEPRAVNRQPISDIEGTKDDDLLSIIPTTERLPEDAAIRTLTSIMETKQFKEDHPGWPYTPRQQYFRILRDYEHVRIPMVRGEPSASPKDTRNPARGFLHMPSWFVEAMVDVGKLRWGISDFGPEASGDTHHFDLGRHDPTIEPDGIP